MSYRELAEVEAPQLPAPRKPAFTSKIAAQRARRKAERRYRHQRARMYLWADILKAFAWSWLCPDRWRDKIAARGEELRGEAQVNRWPQIDYNGPWNEDYRRYAEENTKKSWEPT